MPPDDGGEIGGKAVELRSYIDPTKDDNDSTLHTQLWIDPAEEFLQYTHVGDAVDVTFSLKELKAFLSFCEGCEVDIHLFFDKAGEPILMAPRFGFDDGLNSDFDAMLVLATMLVSQLNEVNSTDHPSVAHMPQSQHAKAANASTVGNPSDHTKIWSDLTGSAARSSEGTRERHVQMEGNPSCSMQNGMQRPNAMNVSPPAQQNAPTQQPMEEDHQDEPQGRAEANINPFSQHHPSNWVGAGDDEEEEEDEDEMYVQSTPHYDD